MRLIILSQAFYAKYPKSSYPEILDKDSRPYFYVTLKVEGHFFAVPLRHHIAHPYCFMTAENAGFDFTKAVVVDDSANISSKAAWIDSSEWKVIKKNENKIFFEFRKYVRQYKRAAANPNNPRSQRIIRYSSLQYFDLT